MSNDHRTCSACRHYFPWQSKGKTLAHCRLNGPTISPQDGSTVWPMVLPTFSCGQWSASPRAAAERAKKAPAEGHGAHCCCLTCLQTDRKRYAFTSPSQRVILKRDYPDLAARCEAALKENP